MCVSLNSPDAGRLRARLFEQIPAAGSATLHRLIDATTPTAVYLVGGAVRDLLLDRPLVDIDLAVEGDAIAAARRAMPDGKLTAYTRFGTASLRVAGTRIDIASSRSESYVNPGALPVVAPAAIECDLMRRDFSINAMALRLSGTPVAPA